MRDLRKKPKKRAGAKKKILRKKVCKFKPDEIITIDYKDINRLRYFVTDRGKILPGRLSGLGAKLQRHILRQVKRARAIALLPFVTE